MKAKIKYYSKVKDVFIYNFLKQKFTIHFNIIIKLNVTKRNNNIIVRNYCHLID